MASIDFDVDDFLNEASTESLLQELSNRKMDVLLREHPLILLEELQRAFDRNDAHEFAYLKGKLRDDLEDRYA